MLESHWPVSRQTRNNGTCFESPLTRIMESTGDNQLPFVKRGNGEVVVRSPVGTDDLTPSFEPDLKTLFDAFQYSVGRWGMRLIRRFLFHSNSDY